MNKQKIFALVLLLFCAIILVMNRDTGSVNLVFDSVRTYKALIYLGFIAVGMLTGILLK